MELHWKWLIIVYLFLGGLGAGAYLTSYAAQKGWLGKSPALNKAGYFIAAPVVAAGTVLLVFDLGQGLRKPWLLIGLILNPRSVMTWGVYILAAFILVGLVAAYFAWKNAKAPSALVNAGAVLALGTGAYTGMLIAVVKAIPFWNNYLTPVLFVVSALSTGMSATLLLAHFMEKGKAMDEAKLNKIHLGLVVAELVALGAWLAVPLSGAKGSVAVQSASSLISGSLAVVFWVVFVGAGLVFPLVVYGINVFRPAKQAEGVPGLELAVPAVGTVNEIAVSHDTQHSSSVVILATDAAVIIGGFALRTVVILAALPIWNGALG